MKRLSLLGFVGMLASVLAGCPIFSDGGGDGCANGHCSSTGTYVGGCSSPADCNQNETCGADGVCLVGDCTSPSTGCVAGYTCTVNPNTMTASCTNDGTGGSGTGGSGTGGSSSSTGTSTGGAGTGGTGSSSSTGTGGVGGAPVYCGHPSDCPSGQTCAPDGTCKPGDCNADGCIFGYKCDAASGVCKGVVNACDGNTDCSTSGYVCIAGPATSGGVCTQPADQCFDQSQCDGGDKCVAGKCVVACTTTADCRDGFKCDTTLGTCSTPAKPCAVTNDCGSATSVCVGGACVPRSTGGTCASGDVWDENGCIPNQAGSFPCNVDGAQDACAMGSICLHHSCWISCDAPSQTICDNQPTLNKCKPVTSSSGTHNVCGTSSNLGGMCDPTAGNSCSGGKVCVDGFCK